MIKTGKTKIWSDINFFTKETDLTRCYTHYNCSVSLHAHTFCEINIITDGFGVHHIFNTNISVSRGNLFIIPPNTPHSYRNDGNLTVRHVLISDRFFSKYNDELKSLPHFHTLFRVHSFLPYLNSLTTLSETHFQTIDAIWQTLDLNALDDDRPEKLSEDDCILSSALVLALISFLCKSQLVPLENELSYVSGHKSSIYKSIEYISTHYDEKITTRQLADICNMSPSSFLKNFKALFNSTPMDYLASQRIAHAKLLLKNQDESVATIAQNTGFFDSAHFNKTFKRLTGVSPLSYRKSHR